MSCDRLYITLSDREDAPWYWASFYGDDLEHFDAAHDEAEKSGLAGLNPKSTVLILSGQMISLQAHGLPPSHRKERQQAALITVKDGLAMDADVHVVLAPEDQQRLAVAAPESLRQALDSLGRYNVSPDAIYAETDLLDLEAGAYGFSDRIIVPGPTGFAVDEQWQSVLPEPHGEGPVPRLDIAGYFTALHRGYISGQAINLASGAFTLSASKTGWTAWRRAAILLICVSLAALGWRASEARAYASAAEQTRQDTAQRYSDYFGTAAPGNPALTVARSLNAQGGSDDGFQKLTLILMQAMNAHDGVRVVSQTYNGQTQTLALELDYPAFETAELLEQAVNQAGGRFIPGGVRQVEDAIRGEAQIRLGDTP